MHQISQMESSRMADTMAEAGRSIDDLMAGYAAGTLPRPLFSMVEAHLSMSPANRRFVADLEVVSALELEGMAPAKIADREEMLQAIFATGDDLAATPSASGDRAVSMIPPALSALVPCAFEDIPWRGVFPGVREYKIGDQEGCRLSMFWLNAGARVPAHTHSGSEVTLVLEGGYTDGFGHYVAGDLAYADGQVDHRPVADDDGDCIGFAITEAPLVLTGPLGRFFNPLMR